MSSKLPETIYKYRDWTNKYHRRILTDRELFIASPKDFNDPLDCRISQNFGLLDTNDKIMEYVKVLSDRHRDKLKASGEKVEDHEARIFDRVKNHKDEEQKRWDDHTFAMQDKHYGVVSFSELWDSILMWGHYGLNHSGFCVGFHEQKLQDSHLFGKGGMVKYTGDFPEIDPKEDYSPELGFIETHTKATEWAYEKEYRLFKLFQSPATIEQRTVKLDKALFAEVNIGIKFPKDQIDEITKFTKDIGIPLYQVRQIPFKFKLTRERLV